MSEIIKTFIKKATPHILKYEKYIEQNDWRGLKWDGEGKPKSNVDIRKLEFDAQSELITTILERLKSFVKISEGDHHLKIFKDFIKKSFKIINTFTERGEDYITDTDLKNIEDVELRTNEILFHRHIYKTVSSVEGTVSSLNIKEDQVTEGIQWLDNQKASIAMHSSIIANYPEIKLKLDLMGIDFTSPPPNTIHILNPKPPIYNSEKNYWEQDKKTLQYYVDEYKKIDYGITIDDYYIDGWLYFHFNFFVTDLPLTVIKNGVEENIGETAVPKLRDNEIIITEYFNKSKREGKMSLIASTRRAAKTTLNSSRVTRALVLGKKKVLCAGGSSTDLSHISTNVDIANENINPAFKLHYLSVTDDKKGKAYGIKTKQNKSKVTAGLYILNLEGGTKTNKKETLAGFTPDEFILDEAFKFPFKNQLDALEPALWASGNLRCYVIITATGGDDVLAADGIKMLNDPIGNKVCLMDWDSLERGVPKDLITWNRKEFGLFLPTQMSVKHRKIKSNLADYLGIKSETLSKVDLYVTDWKNAKIFEDNEREIKSKDKASYVKLLAYHPYDPSEIFLSGKLSPFTSCINEAKAHREYLLQTGKWDRRRELYRDTNGRICQELTDKQLAPFPHKGGNIDAPWLIFEDVPLNKPKINQYTGGFDDYKQDDSDTDSLATFYIWKNETLGDKFSKKIVASISFKPEKHSAVHEQWLLGMEAYNLEGTAFGENEDYKIKDYLDTKRLADKYLAQSLDFTQTFNIPNNLKRKTGWSPSTSKKILFGLFVDYCTEEFTVEDEDGEVKTLKGVQRIDDIGLLDEIIAYTENTNVDRITGAMGGNAYMHYLISSYRWKVKKYVPETIANSKPQPQKTRQKSFYSTPKNRGGFYSTKKR